jgi:hypothetical protein
MALFGPQIETTFMKLHQARRHIEVAAQMLAEEANEPSRNMDEETNKLYKEMRWDLWDHGTFEAQRDRVGKLLQDFSSELEAVSKPVIDREYKGSSQKA